VISPPVPGQDPPASPLRRGRPGYDLASVLAVAVEVFNERGYDRTSMRDLADRLGIAKSAIYHHVAGKEELLRLALDRALAGLSAAADRARVLPAPAIERLEYLIRGSVDVLEAELPYVTLLLRVRGNTEVERAALDQRRAFDRFVAELVAQAAEDGQGAPRGRALRHGLRRPAHQTRPAPVGLNPRTPRAPPWPAPWPDPDRPGR
jgi:AcrR family transcriptional regulator